MKNKNCMYGYIDESGSLGQAMGNTDYIAISVLVFYDEQDIEACIDSICGLRLHLHLSEDYEFHRSTNSPRVKRAFQNMMPTLPFRFFSVAVKKDHLKKTSSYSQIATLFSEELLRITETARIKMDENPQLHGAICKILRPYHSDIKIRQAKSYTLDLLQLADYVVSMSAESLKRPDKPNLAYKLIRRKCLKFIVR